MNLEKKHQQFIDDTKELNINAKEDLMDFFVSNFDLLSILEDPETADELLAAFWLQFEKYYLNAIEIGNEFGEFKANKFKEENG